MIEIALCDDERYVFGGLETLLYKIGKKHNLYLEIDCFDDGNKLLERMRQGESFDIIYLDIRMKQMDGLDTADRIRELDWNVQIVYVTSYDMYMKKAFRVAPIAFITKPIEIDEFEKTFLYILNKITSSEAYYRFKFKKEMYRIPLKEILYFESCGRIILIKEKYGTYKEYNQLDKVEKRVMQRNLWFLRIHKSYLINYRHVIKIGYDKVLMSDGNELPMRRKYQKIVDKEIKKIMEKQYD